MKRSSRIAVLCAAAILITVPAGPGRCAEAAPTKQVTFTGRVLDAAGQPLEGVRVRLYQETYGSAPYASEVALAAEAAAKADGSFSFAVPVESDGYRSGYLFAEKRGLAIGFDSWDMRQDKKLDLTLGEAKPLAGVVVDERGQPIPEASVSIYLVRIGDAMRQRALGIRLASQLLTTRTDTTGRFAFANLPAEATAELLVRKSGKAMVCTFNPRAGGDQPMHYQVGQTDIRLTQPVEAKIEGAVVQKQTGQSVAGITLLVMYAGNRRLDGYEPIDINADGTFTMPGLPAGEYALQLAAPRDGSAQWVAAPVHVTLTTGQAVTGLKIEVSKGGILEVAVTDTRDNTPIEKASVSARASQSGQRSSGTSDAEGIARLRLAPGTYQIDGAYKQGYGQGDRPQTVTIEEGATKRVAVALGKLPRIRGIVHDPDGQPVPGAVVTILPMSREEVSTDAAGTFEITWERTPGIAGREDTVYCLVVRHEQRNLAATVGIDDGTDGLDVKLEPGVMLTGRVVDPDDKGIPNARITPMLRVARWGSSLSRSQIQTDSDGNFAIRAVPAGQKYSINASANGYGSLNTYIESIEAVEGRFDVGTWTLPAANLAVSGQVVDLQGAPAPNASIQGYGEGQPMRIRTQADAQGRFTLQGVCAGRLYVQANVRQGGKDLSAQVVTDGGASDIKIVVREGRGPVQRAGGKSYDQVLATAAKVIAGVTVDEKSLPVAGVPVRVCCHKTMRDGRMTWMYSSFPELNATTDAQGRFAIELKEDGEYNLLFSPDHQAAIIVYDVPIGQKDLKVTLPQGGIVTGRLLRIEKGQKIPIPHAQVKVEQTSRAAFSHLGFDRDRTTLTDSEGRFRFEHLSTQMRTDHNNDVYIPRTWQLSHGATSQTIAFDDTEVSKEVDLLLRPDPASAPALMGRPLPGFDGIGIELTPEQTKGKRVLVCFFDWEQRPSRNWVLQLAKHAELLQEKGVAVAAVDVSKDNDAGLRKWAADSNIPFPIAALQGNREDVFFTWSIKSLPWLVLTDTSRIVTAEGFSPGELDKKLDETGKTTR